MIRRPLAAKLSTAALVTLAITAFSTAASTHVGDHSNMTFAEGLAHPFTGLDHLLAMVAVGLWASQLGRSAIWLLPVTFPLFMAIGAAFGIGGAELPWMEIAIAGSVLMLGVAVALALRPSLVISAALIALFALVHGYSHGVELPASVSALTFGVGFVASTLVLHAIGVAIGLFANRAPIRYVARTVGAAIAALGVFLLVTV